MTVNNGSPGLPDPLRDRTPHGGLSECSWRSGALGVARKVDRHNWRACMVENGRKQLQLHAFHDACSWLLFAGMSDAKFAPRPATAFRRLSQRDDVLSCSQKRRLRAERPEHCRFISPAYPVGRRGAFGCLRHMSRIVCWAAGRSGTRILVLTGPDRVLLLVPARAVSCPAQQQQQPRSPVRAQLHVMQYSGFAIHTLPVMS